jgi:uncharacterized protein with PhoU and TrkA domain
VTPPRRRGEPRPEELEEIEYRPTTVKDLLTEMKDVSELIVDLAYSAVAFDNEAIAGEVNHLETRMDTLNYRIRLTAMMAARTVDDAKRLAGILQVAQAAENISNAAGDIAHVLHDLETRPYLPRVIQRAEERLKQVRVPEESPMAGATLGELEVETETGMRVIAVRRGRTWVYGPGPDTTVEAGDSLMARGTDEGGAALRAWAQEDREGSS